VLRLCSVKSHAQAQSENWVISIARTRCQETQYSLFPICCRLSKLDVAGSNPVSRSKPNHLHTLPASGLSQLSQLGIAELDFNFLKSAHNADAASRLIAMEEST